MTARLSHDLRDRVIRAVDNGESSHFLSVRFGVAVSSVVKRWQRYPTAGSVGPVKMGGHRKPVLEAHRVFPVERISQAPRLLLCGLKDELAVREVTASNNTVWLFIRREGSFKKKPVFALERNRFHCGVYILLEEEICNSRPYAEA